MTDSRITVNQRFYSIVPSDLLTLSQLMAKVKYASDDGTLHSTGLGKMTGKNAKEMQLELAHMLSDFQSKNPGKTEQDFLDALNHGTLPPSSAGGLDANGQMELGGIIEANPTLMP